MPLSFLKPDEQLVLEGPSSVTVVNGPTVAWYAPIVNSARKRKALQLEEQQYAKIKDTLTGTVEIVAGPTLHFMGAYDEHMATDSKIVLLNHQYARLVDAATGDVRVEKGEQTIVPGTSTSPRPSARLRIASVRTASILTSAFRLARDRKTNAVYVDDETAVLVQSKETDRPDAAGHGEGPLLPGQARRDTGGAQAHSR